MNSCSFITSTNNRINNYQCFATILNDDNATIIIEQNKQHYPIEKIFQYLEELKKAGVKITTYKLANNNEIHINYEKKLNILERKYIFITVRFLWEGVNHSEDQFYRIHDHFMRMCEYYPELDRGVLLCIAHDLFLINRPYVNTNHTLTNNNINVLNSKQIQEMLKYSNDQMIMPKFRKYTCEHSDYKTNNQDPNRQFESCEIRDTYSTMKDYDKILRLYKIVD